MADRYAVMGHPVAHSKSPFIHTRFAEQTGQRLVYEAMHVEPGKFREALAAFRTGRGCGLNITLPFKREAWMAAGRRTPRADRAGAVNTIWFEADREVHGDNTDGVGLVRDLVANLGIAVGGKRLLLVGAGGAARGVIGPLLDEGPAAVVVVNRTVSRAVDLCAELAGSGSVRAAAFPDLVGEVFDLVVNATSASLSGALPPLPDSVIGPRGAAYDLAYAERPTPFMRWAEAAGAAIAADGVGMLVEQAAESFLRWRGVRPDTASVIAALRSV